MFVMDFCSDCLLLPAASIVIVEHLYWTIGSLVSVWFGGTIIVLVLPNLA